MKRAGTYGTVAAAVATTVLASSQPARTAEPAAAAAPATAPAPALGPAPAAAPAPAGAADRRGERLFLQCRACHALGRSQDGKIGPPLGGVLGRPAASLPGFPYSKALATSGLTWDAATLDRWLARPTEVVPGTSMVYAGLTKPDDRRQLIAYLERATASP